MEKDNKKTSRCVLVTRFEALSDVVITIPALYDACLANPDVTFIMLTRQSMCGLFLDRPVNLVMCGESSDKFGSPIKMWRIVHDIVNEYDVDAFVDLQGVWRTLFTRVMCKLKGVKVSTIDHGRNEKKRLTRRHDKIMLPLYHTIDRYRDALARVGLRMERLFNGFFSDALPDPSVYSAITVPRQTDEIWIGMAPFAKHEGKIYPLNLMEQVLRELSSRKRTTVFLFGGGPYERKILGEWARKYPSTISLAGERQGFGVEMALLHDMDLLVTMDSANMHLASLVGTPVVAIWGATHPYCGYSGWRVDDENNLQLPIPCRPCSLYGNRPCLTGGYRCLSNLKPDVITARVDALLSKMDKKE